MIAALGFKGEVHGSEKSKRLLPSQQLICLLSKPGLFSEAPSSPWLAGGMGAFGMASEEIKENGPAGLSTSPSAQEPVTVVGQ